MTKQQIIDKINFLKKERERLQYLAEAQDVRQHTYKILLNSSYGVLGSVFYSCYDLDNAEAVTLSGQTVTREMVRFTNNLLNLIEGLQDQEYVIAGDTDSAGPQTILKLYKIKAIKLTIKGKPLYLLPFQEVTVKRNNKFINIEALDIEKTDKLVWDF